MVDQPGVCTSTAMFVRWHAPASKPWYPGDSLDLKCHYENVPGLLKDLGCISFSQQLMLAAG